MARVIKVWNATTSAWEDVAVQQPDTSAFVQNSLVSGKGSLIAATADDTPADLPVGTDGQILYADSGETTGLRWGAAPSGGGGLDPFLLMGA